MSFPALMTGEDLLHADLPRTPATPVGTARAAQGGCTVVPVECVVALTVRPKLGRAFIEQKDHPIGQVAEVDGLVPGFDQLLDGHEGPGRQRLGQFRREVLEVETGDACAG